MVNRLVSGGGAGRLPDEAGEGPGLGDHRPGSSREPSRVPARTAPACPGCTTPAERAEPPIEETTATLNGLVRDGKIRYTGLWDTPAWAVAKAAVIADFRGWAPISSSRLIFPAPGSGPAAPSASRVQTA